MRLGALQSVTERLRAGNDACLQQMSNATCNVSCLKSAFLRPRELFTTRADAFSSQCKTVADCTR